MKSFMKNSMEIDYLEIELRILELKGLQEECRAIRGSLSEMEGKGLARNKVNEVVKSSEEVIRILDEYLIHETILTLEKVKEGFEQSETDSMIQMALLLGA